jgi:hypothetical protein
MDTTVYILITSILTNVQNVNQCFYELLCIVYHFIFILIDQKG